MAAGAFEDDRAGAEESVARGVSDDRAGEAVLDGAGGVEELGLGVDREVFRREAERQTRRAAEEAEEGWTGRGSRHGAREAGGRGE